MHLTPLEVGDDRVDLPAQLGLPRDDPRDLGVQHLDVDGLARVLGFDVRRHRDVVTVLRDLIVRDQPCEVVGVLRVP